MSSFFGNLFGKQENAPDAGTDEVTPAFPQDATTAAPVGAIAEPKQLPPMPRPRYGIDDAIKLMRTLPLDNNVDLVVRVIKTTLESLSVRVSDILEDASHRQEALRRSIAEQKDAIVQLEREIDTRRNEISGLEDQLAETTSVRERLQLAENAASISPPSKAVTAPSSVAPPSGEPAKKPPLPTSFRPKTGPNEPAKPIFPETLDDDEAPVESTDVIEKS